MPPRVTRRLIWVLKKTVSEIRKNTLRVYHGTSGRLIADARYSCHLYKVLKHLYLTDPIVYNYYLNREHYYNCVNNDDNRINHELVDLIEEKLIAHLYDCQECQHRTRLSIHHRTPLNRLAPVFRPDYRRI